jgi:predicted secreted Zn-dependent protease
MAVAGYNAKGVTQKISTTKYSTWKSETKDSNRVCVLSVHGHEFDNTVFARAS